MSDISLSDVNKSFVLRDRTVDAVSNFSLTIEDGTFVSVIGPSGCGKSTLLSIIGGLLKPDSGTVSINRGEKRCGFVFQEPRLLNSCTVKENMILGMKHIKSNSARNQVLADVLELLELTEFINAYPYQLSGGMAQRAALGRALCRQPGILLMDEPFSSLDAMLRKKLQNELVSLYLKKNLTIVFVTHDVSEAVFLGRKVVIMNDGQLIRQQKIDLEYPRNTSSPEFISLCDSIMETISYSRYQV
ncbi:MAG: ABC transporter ATP-binding protein [Spirochaetia bacterium]|nr:ABC transporter ATP-binding protein [Spirochaetia bacterium]